MPVILCIDDTLPVLNILTRIFRNRGLDPIATTSGAEGIGIARTKHIDCVVCDLFMPDVSGREVIQEIRKFSTVPIVIFSTRATDEWISTILISDGATALCQKDFNAIGSLVSDLILKTKKELTL